MGVERPLFCVAETFLVGRDGWDIILGEWGEWDILWEVGLSRNGWNIILGEWQSKGVGTTFLGVGGVGLGWMEVGALIPQSCWPKSVCVLGIGAL